MTRKSLHRAAAVAVAALLLLVLEPSAQATPTSSLEFAGDDTTWSRTPPSAVFTEDIVLVPGHSAAEVLHLRNAAESTGALTVSIANVTVSPADDAEAFYVKILSDTGEGIDPTGLAKIIATEEPTASYILEPGESTALTVTVGLDAAVTGSVAQNSVLRLDVRVVFTDARAIPDENGAPHNPAPSLLIPLLPSGDLQTPSEQAPSEATNARGLLASTGINGGALLLAAAALLTSGALALVVRRRREQS